MCAAIARISSGANGGFASKLPSVGRRSRKEPTEPKAPSTSGNAEQKGAVRALSGEANASAVHPKHRRSTANAAPPSAAWNPEPPMVL